MKRLYLPGPTLLYDVVEPTSSVQLAASTCMSGQVARPLDLDLPGNLLVGSPLIGAADSVGLGPSLCRTYDVGRSREP
jgi:hypothetical protein